MEKIHRLRHELNRHIFSRSLPLAVLVCLVASLAAQKWHPELFLLWMSIAFVVLGRHLQSEETHKNDIMNSWWTFFAGGLFLGAATYNMPAISDRAVMTTALVLAGALLFEVFYHEHRHSEDEIRVLDFFFTALFSVGILLALIGAWLAR